MTVGLFVSTGSAGTNISVSLQDSRVTPLKANRLRKLVSDLSKSVENSRIFTHSVKKKIFVQNESCPKECVMRTIADTQVPRLHRNSPIEFNGNVDMYKVTLLLTVNSVAGQIGLDCNIPVY